MRDFPEYSDSGKDAKDLFLFDSNAIIFYFEDSRHESVYERLVQLLIPNLRRFAVVCLGGKSKLIAKAKDPRCEGVVSIFVADKDFDDLLGKTVNVDSFYYLERNCLENYFLDLKVLGAICIEENPDLTGAAISERLADQERYLQLLQERYESLTRLFLVALKYRVENLKTTKMSVDDLLAGTDQDFPLPTEDFVSQYRKKLQAHCHGDNEWLSDDGALDVQIEEAFSPVTGGSSNAGQVSHHLCGKHLFRCLIRYLQARLDVDIESLDPRSLYLRILAHLDLSPFYSLRDTLLHGHPDLVRAC